MSTTRTSACLAAVAAAGLLASCTTTHGPAKGGNGAPAADASPMVDTRAWPKPTPQQGLAKGLRLPLEDYMQGYGDTVTLDEGKRHLAERCMGGYGLTVHLPKAGTNPSPSWDDANMERRYGLTDPDAAAQFGYRLPGDRAEPVRQKVPDLTDVEIEVLTGHAKPPAPAAGAPVRPGGPARASYNGKALHKNGCAGWAKQQIGGPAEEELQFVSELNGQSFTESMKAQPVKDALAAWSACMDGKGYPGLKDPFAAADSVQHAGAEPTAEEKKLAVAEVDCKQATHLVGIWHSEETKIQKDLVGAHRARLDAVRDANTAAVKAATAQTG